MPDTATHTRSAIYGWEGQRTARCSCGEEYAGPTIEAIAAAHDAHVASFATQPGLAKARRSLADAIARGKPT